MSQWSTELRGLAVGRQPFEFLVNGKPEEQALDTLFKGMNSTSMVSLMSEIIANILGQPGVNSISTSRLAGRFPRICVFVRLFGISQCDDSVEPQAPQSPSQALENLLSSAICSVQLAGDGRKQAIIITLARVFFNSMHVLTLTNVTNSVRLYEKWFLAILRTAPKPGIKFLVEMLQELIPLEPLPYLRCQIKCFRRVPSWFSISQDYIAVARTRSKDLDPSGHAGGDANTREGGRIGDSTVTNQTAVQDVCKFVVEFHREGGKMVPQSLVRQMNFHRHHFRSNTLETLLMPDMNPPQEVINSQFARGGIEDFDLKRIALIKVLAYERKDRAITKEEADSCIPKIHAEIRRRRMSLVANPKGVLTRVEPAKDISEDSPLFDVFEEFCDASTPNLPVEEGPSDVIIDVDASNPPSEELKRWKKAEKVLCEKLIQFTDLAEGAATMLQLVVDRVYISLSEQDPGGLEEDEESRNLFDRTQYLRLWQLSEPWLLCLLTRALSRKRQKVFWETLKLQVIAALCVQTRRLSVKQVIGIAVFLFAIVKFSEKSDQRELPFLVSKGSNSLVHVVTTVAKSLPLDCKEHVQRSVQFSVCYLMLAIANSQNPTRGEFLIPDKGLQELPIFNGPAFSSTGASAALPSELIQIVHWVLCEPWRLQMSRVGPTKGDDDSLSAHYVLSLVRGALSVTKALEVFRCKKFSLQDWVRVEVRSGWGPSEEVVKILRKFQSAVGSSLQVIADAVSEVSSLCASGTLFPSWIVLGMSEFAQDLQSEQSELWKTKSLSHIVQNCFNRNDSDAGSVMIRIVKQLPPNVYFHHDTIAHIYLHVQQILSPTLWPFSNVLVRFLLQAIADNSIPEDGEESLGNQLIVENPPSTLVAAISILLGTSHSDNFASSAASQPWTALMAQVKSFKAVFSLLNTNASRRAEGAGALSTQALGTQAVNSQLPRTQTGHGGSKLRKGDTSSSKLRRAVQQHPETLALGVVDLAAKRASDVRAGDTENLWAGVEHLCAQLGHSLAVDVLDVAVDIAAQLPVMRANAARAGLCADAERWCAGALRELLRLRLQLWRTQVPFWAAGSCAEDETPFFVRRTREELGLVSECAVNDPRETMEDQVRPLKRRRAGSGSGCSTQLHMVWQARIGAALGSIDGAAFDDAMQMCTADGEPLGLLTMLAGAVRSVRSANVATLLSCFRKMRHAPRSEHAVGVLLGSLDTGLCKAIERAGKASAEPVPLAVRQILESFVPHLLEYIPAPSRRERGGSSFGQH